MEERSGDMRVLLKKYVDKIYERENMIKYVLITLSLRSLLGDSFFHGQLISTIGCESYIAV